LILVCYLGGLVAPLVANISGIQWMEFKDEDIGPLPLTLYKLANSFGRLAASCRLKADHMV